MSRASSWLFLLVAAAAVAPAAACSKVPMLRGEIEGLDKLLNQAEQNGAKRCAPRELALGRAHAEFAGVEIDQADLFRAEDHMQIARANAQAAYDLSPPGYCAERRFAAEEPKPLPPPVPKIGDKDGDGYLDNSDGCPNDPENYNGFKDEDGCPDDPDSDADGLADSKDACPLLAEDKDNYLDEDGCPDVDNDLDDVIDDVDGQAGACKDNPEDPDGFNDADGCPEDDNDGDTVPDLKDECPNIPGVKDGPKPGCPQKPTLAVITATEIKITQQIHFAFDKSTIRPESYPVLDAVTDILKKNPTVKLEVQGHTDNQGSAVYNKRLSQDRAGSVVKYLTSKGIDAGRLVAKGYGLEIPLVPNDNERNRAINRRVQFIRTEGGPK
ncbi:MAG: OmpA family protein [Myxococcales bacterium]|nr:OmpA family protein [Myxococcales bacterium]